MSKAPPKPAPKRRGKPASSGDAERDYVADIDAAARELLIYLLNASLATELVCVLRYRLNHFKARSFGEDAAAHEFLKHSNQEQAHADAIAKRITQLGGSPNFSPVGLVTRSHVDYVEAGTLSGMLRENLVAEQIAIDKYRALVRYVSDTDVVTRRMMEEILVMEESHASELAHWEMDAGEARRLMLPRRASL
jgi:bacterioferritin